MTGAVAVICPSCDEANSPGVPFCVFCGTYLGWDQVREDRPSGGSRPPVEPDPPLAAHATQPTVPTVPTVVVSTPVPVTEVPVPPGSTGGQRRCPECGRPNDDGPRFCVRCAPRLRVGRATSGSIQ